MNNTRKTNQHLDNVREIARKLSDSSSPIKLMILVMAMVLIVTSLVGPFIVRHHVHFPIPPLAVGGGIDMTLDEYEAEAYSIKPDSVHIHQLTNTSK